MGDINYKGARYSGNPKFARNSGCNSKHQKSSKSSKLSLPKEIGGEGPWLCQRCLTIFDKMVHTNFSILSRNQSHGKKALLDQHYELEPSDLKCLFCKDLKGMIVYLEFQKSGSAAESHESPYKPCYIEKDWAHLTCINYIESIWFTEDERDQVQGNFGGGALDLVFDPVQTGGISQKRSGK